MKNNREIRFRAWEASEKYVAGSDGLIYSTDFNHTGKTKALKGGLDKDGYPHVLLNINGKRLWRSNHKLVALAYIGERPKGMFINHKNGIRNDARPENLEYITPSENALHGFRVNGRKHTAKQIAAISARSKWTGNPKAKLNHKEVAEIRHLRNECKQSLREVADLFGISRSQVSSIALGRSWKYE